MLQGLPPRVARCAQSLRRRPGSKRLQGATTHNSCSCSNAHTAVVAALTLGASQRDFRCPLVPDRCSGQRTLSGCFRVLAVPAFRDFKVLEVLGWPPTAAHARMSAYSKALQTRACEAASGGDSCSNHIQAVCRVRGCGPGRRSCMRAGGRGIHAGCGLLRWGYRVPRARAEAYFSAQRSRDRRHRRSRCIRRGCRLLCPDVLPSLGARAQPPLLRGASLVADGSPALALHDRAQAVRFSFVCSSSLTRVQGVFWCAPACVRVPRPPTRLRQRAKTTHTP